MLWSISSLHYLAVPERNALWHSFCISTGPRTVLEMESLFSHFFTYNSVPWQLSNTNSSFLGLSRIHCDWATGKLEFLPKGGKKCTFKTEVIHQSIYLFCFVSYHLLISFGQTTKFSNILLSKDKRSSFWAPKQSELGKHKFQEIRNIGFLDWCD